MAESTRYFFIWWIDFVWFIADKFAAHPALCRITFWHECCDDSVAMEVFSVAYYCKIRDSLMFTYMEWTVYLSSFAVGWCDIAPCDCRVQLSLAKKNCSFDRLEKSNSCV